MTKTKKKTTSKAKKPKKKLVKNPTKERVNARVEYTANVKTSRGERFVEKKRNALGDADTARHSDVKGYTSKKAAQKRADDLAKGFGKGAVGYVSEQTTNLNIPRKNYIRKK